MSDLDPRSLFARDTSPFPLLTGAGARRVFLDERGAATAEYAIATMATVAKKDVPKVYPRPLSCVSRRTDRRRHEGWHLRTPERA
ncbi:DUF4244 domain-containing protein [Microbacterium sp. NPDC007973]|uniref:DUF4244 domain-containing protein n=1 Tax=Microbacterium sp. NPDC007973 TaxID=3364182 RepID=UPI0036E275C9